MSIFREKEDSNMPVVLCVSEDKAFLNTVRLSLGQSGFVAITSSSEAEALELAEDPGIDAIICDYDLSLSDGISLWEKIRDNTSTGARTPPPTLIVSEQYAAPLLSRCVNAGAAGLHSKQEPPEQLLERVISLLRDPGKRRHVERTAGRRAVLGGTDPLTKVASKQHFVRRFSAESVASYRDANDIAVLMMSVDRFDRIIERHGEQMADTLLAQAARIIEGELRSRDCVGRYSDHTFAVVLPETSLKAATSVAKRLSRTLSTSEYGNLDHPIAITLSVGVSGRPAGMRASPDELSTQALKNSQAADSMGGDKVLADTKLTGKPIALLLGPPDERSVGLAGGLEARGIEVRMASSVEEGQQVLKSIPASMIAVMHPLPEFDGGTDFLIWARTAYPGSRRILITDTMDLSTISKVVNEARIDFFIPQPWQATDLGVLVEDLAPY